MIMVILKVASYGLYVNRGCDDAGNGSHAIISSDHDYLFVLGYWVCCHSFIMKIEADDGYLSILLLA